MDDVKLQRLQFMRDELTALLTDEEKSVYPILIHLEDLIDGLQREEQSGSTLLTSTLWPAAINMFC